MTGMYMPPAFCIVNLHVMCIRTSVHWRLRRMMTSHRSSKECDAASARKGDTALATSGCAAKSHNGTLGVPTGITVYRHKFKCSVSQPHTQQGIRHEEPLEHGWMAERFGKVNNRNKIGATPPGCRIKPAT